MGQISIKEFCGERDAGLIDRLADVWDVSVRTSHHFLTEEDITGLRPQVKAALQGIEHLIVVWDGDAPEGFMGIQEQKIEMLFLSSSCIGKGIGKELINIAINEYDAVYVDVNEQNERRKAFTGTWVSVRFAETRPMSRATHSLYFTCNYIRKHNDETFWNHSGAYSSRAFDILYQG